MKKIKKAVLTSALLALVALSGCKTYVPYQQSAVRHFQGRQNLEHITPDAPLQIALERETRLDKSDLACTLLEEKDTFENGQSKRVQKEIKTIYGNQIREDHIYKDNGFSYHFDFDPSALNPPSRLIIRWNTLRDTSAFYKTTGNLFGGIIYMFTANPLVLPRDIKEEPLAVHIYPVKHSSTNKNDLSQTKNLKNPIYLR